MKLHNVDVNDIVTSVMSTFKLKVEKYGGVIDADSKPKMPSYRSMRCTLPTSSSTCSTTP